MNQCHHCMTSDQCRIPEELGRMDRVRKAIVQRGGHPWLEARIEQYMAVPVCLSSLFGLEDLHAKIAELNISAPPENHKSPGASPYVHVPHHSVALEITLRRHQARDEEPPCGGVND